MNFRKDVAIQAVLYVLQQLGGTADMHKVFKTLYFADQMHLAQYARSITGDDFIAMDYGPVPSQIYDLFKALRGKSFFSIQSEEYKSLLRAVNRFDFQALQAPDLDYFSQTDLECLNAAIELCRDKGFNELVALSHGKAWNNTKLNRTISMKDVLSEVGEEEGYIEFVVQNNKMSIAYP